MKVILEQLGQTTNQKKKEVQSVYIVKLPWSKKKEEDAQIIILADLGNLCLSVKYLHSASFLSQCDTSNPLLHECL